MTNKTDDKVTKAAQKKAAKAKARKADAKKAEKAAQVTAAAKADAPARSGLTNVPTPRVGKNLRRMLRAKGIWFSKDGGKIGKVPVVTNKAKDGTLTYNVTVDGTEYGWTDPATRPAVAPQANQAAAATS